ncbi:MAG: DUF58 domain-containing protein [Clostridia bacterium]|nr:DUF58 domain-containing protein [Clostridia bacterium]
MAKIRLIYALFVVITGLFVVMYVDSLSLLLFIVTLALPIFLFLLLLLARILTRIKIEPPTTLSTKGQAVSMKIHLKNLSFIALPSLRATITYCGAFSSEPEKTEITFPLHALTNQTSSFDISSNHVGVVKVDLHNIYMHDYFRLFRFKFKINQSYEITFLPELHPLTMDIRPNTLLGVDSDVFSKSKKGDDPSEVFAIRDYIGGDKLNRIHWKLSSKQDNLMVKDYSLPINNSISIIPELASPSSENLLKDIDAVIETAFNLSNFLCEAEIIHHICWYDPKSTRFFDEEIKDTDDMFAALGLMLSCGIDSEGGSLDFWKKDRPVCSHVAYITALQNASALSDLGEMSYSTFYSVFKIGDELENAEGTAGLMQFFNVNPENVSDSLAGIML